MRKSILAILILVNETIAVGQNLVPNPSFEVYDSCPNSLSTPFDDQITRATGWNSYHDTPDYYNTCASVSSIKVPSNNAGYQFPHTGNAYCGGATYNKNGLFREIIGRQLSAPLTIGQKYYVSFYTTLSGKPGCNFATNNLGVKFTTSPFNYNTDPIPIDNFAHVYFNALITDTINWKLISGSFIADSAYQYIAIGNFFDDAHTDTFCIATASLTLDGYYYLDDICVSTDSNYCANWTGINEQSPLENFKVYPNPTNQFATIEFRNPTNQNCTLTLYDLRGQVVRTINNIAADKVEIDRQTLANGLYFFQVLSKTQIIANGKLTIE